MMPALQGALLWAGLAVVGPFLPHAPHFDGVVAVSIDGGPPRCGAVVVAPHLALSIASCLLSATTFPLSETEQLSCLRGSCEGAVIAPERLRLIGGPDARIGAVVARVKRIAVRFTAYWAIPLCTTALCGEGWDVALLELDPSCNHGPLACVPPARVATTPATIGIAPTAVGFGAFPSYNRRDEFDLSLPVNGSGVRRAVVVRFRDVASKQRATAEVRGSSDGAPPFCAGDDGAALLTERAGVWELDGLRIPTAAPAPPLPDALACGSGEGAASVAARAGAAAVMSAYAARCWIEAAVAAWGLPALISAHADGCGGRDFFPPELDARYLAGSLHAGDAPAAEGGEGFAPVPWTSGGVELLGGGRLSYNCSTTTCELGVCVSGGGCVCAAGVYGPRCTLRGPPPPATVPVLASIAVSPEGEDTVACGAAAAPCATLRRALERQAWQVVMTSGDGGGAGAGEADGGGGVGSSSAVAAAAPAIASITLLEGTFRGEGNRELVLHGTPLHIKSLRGPRHSWVDCRHPTDGSWGVLFLRGESAGVSVTGLTLRKCLADEQVQVALAALPEYYAAVAGGARWPAERAGVVWRANSWMST